ncbi:hypothetical protein [Mesoterricola sediminis]|uniref:Uncharacterized protein n=1 Tax=Mesoterricola sediminis TaxID=2927980 RepID=A0AA48KFY8_9BACT|nr:hypothetical protein [Mesoterricola sediminis]BDU76913.1 hypothetical protein METESE_18710 [Mesoterricola sediminis]
MQKRKTEHEPLTPSQRRLLERIQDSRRREAEFEASWDPRERGEAPREA